MANQLQKGETYRHGCELLTFHYCYSPPGRKPIYAFTDEKNSRRWLSSDESIAQLIHCPSFTYKDIPAILIPHFADGGNGSKQRVNSDPIYWQIRWTKEGVNYLKELFLTTEIAITAFKHYLDNGFFDMTINDKFGNSITKERFANHV
jgi:hypothetical protein